MKLFRIKPLNNRGDTIVEVLIVLAVLSLAFGTSTGIATRSLHQSRTAEEHSQALGLLNTQLEQLRSAATTGADVFQDGKSFCMTTANTPDYGFVGSYVIPANLSTDDFTKYAPACKGVDTFYNQSIVYDSASGDYTIRVRWDGVGTLGRQQEITSYRVYKLTTSVAASLATVTECSDGNDNDGDTKIDQGDPGCHTDGNASNPISYNDKDGDETDPACMDTKDNDVPQDHKIDIADPGCHSDAIPGNPASYTPTRTTEANAVCSDGNDNDGDTKIDLADPGCSGNPAGVTEVGAPSPAIISPDRFDAPAWHLFNIAGSKQNQTFTITNPGTSDSSLSITSTTITGPNANSFQITSSGSGCAGRVLARGASCTVNIQFFPPSGGANNSLGNAGLKTATLSINNSNGVAATNAVLTGWAVSDRMAPGDRMYITGDDNDNAARGLRAYNVSCYNNAFACGNLLVMWANGNLVEYTDAIAGSVAFATGATSATQLIMQPGDGNLVMYDSVGNPIYARGPVGANAWLMLFTDSQLWRMQPSYAAPDYSAGYDRVWP